MKSDFKPRLYQEIILGTATKQNTLVVLPTGLGKTAIAAMLMEQRFSNYKDSKVLLLAPTKPLAQQHEKTLKDLLPEFKDETVLFTGSVKPEKRQELWEKNKIIISTPQGMENDIISRKIKLEDVSLLIFDECLTEDSKITLFDNTTKDIKSIVSEFHKGKSFYAKAYNEKKQIFETKKITDALKIPCIKRLNKITTTNEEIIKATEDHKFFVKRKNKYLWVESGDLCTNDFLAIKKENLSDKNKILVSDEDILKTYSEEQITAAKKYYEILGIRNKYKEGQSRISNKTNVSSRNVENYIYRRIKPISVKNIENMKKNELLPFTNHNKHILKICRIMGHLFGDGHISINQKGTIILGFSGKIEDLKEIQKDLKSMNIKYSNIYSRTTISELRNITGQTNSFTCTDVKFTKLVHLLANFSGKKTIKNIEIPKWILNGSKEMKAEFLGALFGSDGTKSSQKTASQSFYTIRLTFNKLKTLKNSGKKLSGQIQEMLKNLNIKTCKLRIIDGTTWKTGEKTDKFIITIANSNENLLSFLESVGYKYCKYKERAAFEHIEYLSTKKEFKKQKNLQKKAVLWLAREGYSNSEISNILKVEKHQVESWKYNNSEIASYPSFKISKTNQKFKHKEIMWDKIKKIEEIRKTKYVYDLTVQDNHNFIANNILVHNCHRATGDYAYVFVAKKYSEVSKNQRILALTASPGSDQEKIMEIIQNLYIEEIEYRDQESSDVKEYIQEMKSTFIKVELTEEMKRIKMFLEKCYKSKIDEAVKLGYINGDTSNYTKTTLLKIMAGMHAKIATGEKEFEILKTVSLLAEAMKVQHALELLETQDVQPLRKYLHSLEKQALTSKVKAVKNLVQDLNFRSARLLADKLDDADTQHPKIEKLVEEVKKEVFLDKDCKIIIFTQFRDTATKIKKILGDENITSELFVGQAKKKDTGLSQKQQKQMIEDFESGKFTCLIATSVGEEGLDIPEVDLVLFYEPIPSAIRTVQRRGRTGRQKKGKVITLITKNSRDEGYRWAAHHKEKRMYRILSSIKNTLNSLPKKITTLHDFTKNDEPEIIIRADYREKGSPVLKELMEDNVHLSLERLEIGDYLLAEHTVVEFKTVADFVDSILDGRLLSQARELKQYYKPLIIIEGEQDIYSQRRIHPNAIRGMIATLTIGLRIPIIQTTGPKDTAQLLKIIARREQDPEHKDFQMHTAKPMNDKEIQEYIISSIPGIGARLAPFLLNHFGSIKNIVNASEEELQAVELIGKVKAKRIKELMEKEYKE